MITQKLRNIYALSIPLFMVHILEEYFTGFYHVYEIPNILGRFGFSLGGNFLVVQISLLILLIVGFLLIRKNILAKTLSIIVGLVMFYEFYHIYKAVSVGGYYPGLITALFFPVIGFFYWKDLLKLINKKYE